MGKSEPSYKKGGNGSTCVELIFPVEVNLPGFIYLPSIFCEPGNSAATTGTSDEAWTSWLWQADRLTTRASDTVLHSSGSCGRGNLSCKSSYLHCHFFSVPCAPQSYRSRNCFKWTNTNEWRCFLISVVRGGRYRSCTRPDLPSQHGKGAWSVGERRLSIYPVNNRAN